MSVTETDPLRSQVCDEARVVQALEAYIAEAEQGRAPDRSTFLREHAEVAGELEACLDGLALVNSIAGRLRPTSTPGEGNCRRGLDVGPATCLGDFRIVREVGRGGMGIVYEAEQISLGRRVALKVLPFTAALDPRQLQRFKVEAQAAAQLHHTNIVPVFAVGSDRGVHYYAMQFIDGYTLADIIGELRETKKGRDKPSLIRTSIPSEPHEGSSGGHGTTIASGPRAASGGSGEPTAGSGSTLGIASRGRAYYRTVARLGVQASRALEHAHALGVLHRDVKPANLMVDVRGNLWITDFGLARFQDEAGLTLTGDLLGTLRYMSPEQARGKPALVDHRSDLYSLGTTIYELLTFRPAFEGRDRAELLRSIADVEPVAPRKLDPGIPRELETIVLKAMAKEPHERYPTAQDLGDDLQRFLDDKPIHARRPSPLDLAAKWARRHRSIVATAAVLLLLLVCALSVGTVMIAHERDIAEAQKRETIEKFQFTREVLDDLYRMIVDREPALDPGVSELQREFLERVLVYYNQIAAETSDDPVVRRDSALAFRQVGDIEYRLGKPDRAEQAYRYGLELLNDLADDPDAKELGIPRETASLCKCLGRLLQATIRDGEAEALFRRAITVQSEAVEGQDRVDGRTRTQLAHSHLELGVLLEMQGRTEEAVAEYNRALGLTRSVLGTSREPDPDEVTHLNNLALRATIQSHLNFVRSDFKAAADENQRAIEYYRTLRANHPSSSESRAKLAHAYFRHAWMVGDPRFAEIYDPEKAMRLSREAVEIDPQNAAYHHKRGVMLMQTGDARQAREEFEHVLKLVPDSPDAHNTLAWLMATAPDPAIRNPQRAVELAKQAVKETHEVGIYWNTLGVALYQAGEYREAIVALTRAAELRNQGDSYDWFFLAMAHWRLGRRSEAFRWYQRAVEWMEINRRYNTELKHFREMAEALLGSTSPTTPGVSESADSGANPPKEDLAPARRNPETSRRAEDPRTPGGSPFLISATVSPGGDVPATSRGAASRASGQQALRGQAPLFQQPSRVLRIVPIPVALPEAGMRPIPRD